MVMRRGFSVWSVLWGVGSAADACGVTNKEGCELIKPSDGAFAVK